jgi:hypothetical protein
MELLNESGAYDPATGVLSEDPEVKIYEVKPGISAELAALLGLAAGPSFHFVLNDTVYQDNRIPPRGFLNEQYASFGGAPVAYRYEDGQYWDRTEYTVPLGTARAEVDLYYQSTSKEFVEFLRDENTTDSKGQELYELWNDNGKCPPTLMTSAVWVPTFEIVNMHFTQDERLQIDFRSRPGVTYTIEYVDGLDDSPTWQTFQDNGTIGASGSMAQFVDDFTANTSGGPSSSGVRFYRIQYTEAP